MPRFFVNEKPETSCVITGEDAVHIGRSLRMKTGEEITVCHDGVDYSGVVERITDSEVFVKVIKSAPSSSEPDVFLTLFQAMPKGDKVEMIIQKAVELGASRVVLVMTDRCVSRPDEKSFSKKLSRYQKISESAAKQSGRGIIPEISGIINVKQAVKELSECDISLICYEKGGISLNDAGLEKGKSVGVFIGSEGGFEEKEVQMCVNNGVKVIGLGNRILRCETAPLAAISIIMNITGNM
ncbi:MAG: 16S rRNA (uracil(1498)-N(3))-methyltransferase [Ruminococcus sp.]|nr:16S rRNA (uracil(1498)-N(3))-methyltransferase [Ruminococcus sp.]